MSATLTSCVLRCCRRERSKQRLSWKKRTSTRALLGFWKRIARYRNTRYSLLRVLSHRNSSKILVTKGASTFSRSSSTTNWHYSTTSLKAFGWTTQPFWGFRILLGNRSLRTWQPPRSSDHLKEWGCSKCHSTMTIWPWLGSPKDSRMQTHIGLEPL